MTWMSASSARQQLRKEIWALNGLADAGCIGRRVVKGRTQFDLEPGDTPTTLMCRFYSDHAPCLDVVTCAKVKNVVTLLQGFPKLSPPPAFMEDAMRVIRKDEHLSLKFGTLMSLTAATETVAREFVENWCADNDATVPQARRHHVTPEGSHEALVLARLPAHLQAAPGTYLAPSGHPDDKPSEAMFARLNRIQNPVLFEAITLDTLRLTAANTATDVTDRSIRSFMRFDERLGDGDARDPFVLRTVLVSMLGPDWASFMDAVGNSADIVVRYAQVFERLEEYIERVVPAARRPAFRAQQLTMPAGHEKFFRQVRSAVKKYQKASMANRQVRIEAVLDHPLEFLLVGRLRLQEHKLIRDACRKKIDELIKAGRPLTEPVRFQFSYTTKLINDRFRTCKQTIHLAVWPWDLVHARLRATFRGEKAKRVEYFKGQAEDLGSRSGYVVAYLGVTPQTPGGPTQEPLVAQVAQSFILSGSALLPPELLKRKLAAHDDWQFPERSALPTGLPWFEQSRRYAVQEAITRLNHEMADGTEGPVVLLPHDEFCHGLMFAHSSIFIAADAGCRTGETLLAPSQSAKFEPITDPATGDVFKRFDSIGKGGLPVRPMMSPDTFGHFTDMIVEGAARWHGGRLPPPVAPNSQFVKRKITTVARYAFTVGSRMINYAEIATLTRILFLGWHSVEGHDVRHIFNAMGRRAGIPPEIRQRLLNHAAVETEAIYGPATPSEVNRRQIQLNRQTSDNMAALLKESADGMSADMIVALRELQRAELNVRFYEKEGCLEEAEGIRREVEVWADRLARATAEHNGASKVINAAAI